MSQFIIFSCKNTLDFDSFLIDNISGLKENYTLFKECYKLYFKDFEENRVFTILDFDDLCIEAQEEFVFSETRLYKLLSLLKDERLIMWYSHDFDDLDKIHSIDVLLSQIEKEIHVSSGELYINYSS